jgi:hypothetical protein
MPRRKVGPHDNDHSSFGGFQNHGVFGLGHDELFP